VFWKRCRIVDAFGHNRHHFAWSRSRRRELSLGKRRPWASKIRSARACARLITNIRRDGAGLVLEYVERNYKIGDTASILLRVPIVRLLPCPGLHLKNACVKYMNHNLAEWLSGGGCQHEGAIRNSATKSRYEASSEVRKVSRSLDPCHAPGSI
jgi:hypothetical protein